jgi:hypothetical protein
MDVSDWAMAWQIGNYGRFSKKCGEHIRLECVSRPELGRLADALDAGAA